METSQKQINRRSLLFRLAHMSRRWRQILDSEFQSHGLTDATWRPLLHLKNIGDGVCQKDLAASLGIESPSLVRLLDTLSTKGLIRRVEDSNDRRAKLLFLTPEGEILVMRILETATSFENELFGLFTESEILQFTDFVTRLESTMSSRWLQGKP